MQETKGPFNMGDALGTLAHAWHSSPKAIIHLLALLIHHRKKVQCSIQFCGFQFILIDLFMYRLPINITVPSVLLAWISEHSSKFPELAHHCFLEALFMFWWHCTQNWVFAHAGLLIVNLYLFLTVQLHPSKSEEDWGGQFVLRLAATRTGLAVHHIRPLFQVSRTHTHTQKKKF